MLFRHGSTSNNSGIVETLEFVEHSVLQLPLFLLTLMRYITPALDQMYLSPLGYSSPDSPVWQVHGLPALG